MLPFCGLIGEGGLNSTPLKYASILLCALFALLWAWIGGGDGLVALAMGLTAAADTFLLELNVHYAVGLLLFCGGQLCYFLRIFSRRRRSLWGLRLSCFFCLFGGCGNWGC